MWASIDGIVKKDATPRGDAQVNVTALTLLALESPERIGEEVTGGILERGPEIANPEQWLLLLAAVLCGCPEMANAAAIRRLEALLHHPDADAETLRMAGEVLKFAIASPMGKEAAGAAMRLLANRGISREVYQAAIGSLRWAAVLGDASTGFRGAAADRRDRCARALLAALC